MVHIKDVFFLHKAGWAFLVVRVLLPAGTCLHERSVDVLRNASNLHIPRTVSVHQLLAVFLFQALVLVSQGGASFSPGKSHPTTFHSIDLESSQPSSFSSFVSLLFPVPRAGGLAVAGELSQVD